MPAAPAKTGRNLSIGLRRALGEQRRSIADDYGISPARVVQVEWQGARRVHVIVSRLKDQL